ncbi:SH2 domain-containing protein 6 [Megalops cyprinoides]|uniref:SH2 domain-containing protein 6 n=1 Tax=Megalops cyprinoides TaxID=118141 RepID=UPI001865464D|nr:SH2 domain-containing protein 6 [Megalops cyprinoides]
MWLRHSGPPAPPKRIDNSPAYGWPEDEFDEEDGDTYEAPPCEPPPMKVPPRQVEENVYLERSPAPDPSRQAPPPRPAKMTPIGKVQKQERHQDSEETYIDPNAKKPPQINREEKPGKKLAVKKTPPSRPAPAPVPPPAAASHLEEDVYLNPNEGQHLPILPMPRAAPEGDNDDLYLEPNAACPPPPRVAGRMPPPPKVMSREALPPKTGPRKAPPPMKKPPVPGAQPISPPTTMPPQLLPSAYLPGDSKTAPPPEVRRPPFPAKLPPPTPGMKPPLPSSLKESKPSPPPPPQVDSTVGGPKSTQSGTEESRLQDKEWFAGNCDRRSAEAVLYKVNKDGAFLVRRSSAQNARQPYTLVVLYRQKVYNIPVRFLEDTGGYALGKEGKRNEEFFSSLQEIISHHKNNPILLIDSKSQAKHTTYLTHPARP